MLWPPLKGPFRHKVFCVVSTFSWLSVPYWGVGVGGGLGRVVFVSFVWSESGLLVLLGGVVFCGSSWRGSPLPIEVSAVYLSVLFPPRRLAAGSGPPRPRDSPPIEASVPGPKSGTRSCLVFADNTDARPLFTDSSNVRRCPGNCDLPVRKGVLLLSLVVNHLAPLPLSFRSCHSRPYRRSPP